MSSTSDEKKQQLKNELKGMVDLLVDGPGEDQHADAMRALITVGRMMGAASWAFDHEMGRVKSGRWQSPMHIGLFDDRLPQDAREEIGQEFPTGMSFAAEEVRGWQQLGKEGGSPDEDRAFLADTIRNLAWCSRNPRFSRLATALYALETGEVMSLLKPRRGTIGKGAEGYNFQVINHRKRAVLGIVYNHHKRFVTPGERVREGPVRKEIAPFYYTHHETMRKWKPALRKEFGEEFDEEIKMAAFRGLMVGMTDIPDEFAETSEREYGIEALKKDGERYNRLRRL